MRGPKVSMIGTLPPLKGISPYCAELLGCLSGQVEIEFLNFKRLYPEKLYPGGTREDDLYPTVAGLREERLEVRDCIDFCNPLSWFSTGFSLCGEIVHAHWWTGVLAPVYHAILGIARARKKRIIMTVHNVEPHEKGLFQGLMHYSVLDQAHEFIVHNESNREKLLQRLGRCPKPVHVVPHVPFLSAMRGYEKTVSKDAARNDLGIKRGDKVLLFFGNIREYKGLDVLIKALPMVTEHHPNTKLVVAGQPWEEWSKYQEIIEAEGLRGNVITRLAYLPFHELHKYISACDLAVFPFKNLDSASGSVVLARSLGKPVVVSDACDLDERKGGGVFLAKTGCPVSLAETIRTAFKELPSRAPAGGREDQELERERALVAFLHLEIYFSGASGNAYNDRS